MQQAVMHDHWQKVVAYGGHSTHNPTNTAQLQPVHAVDQLKVRQDAAAKKMFDLQMRNAEGTH